jgi:general stress protein 26
MSLMDKTADAADVSRLLAGAAETIGKVHYCWLVTAATEGGTRCRPMGWLPRDKDEDEWTLRFLTDGHSHKAADMRRVDQVSVLFQHDPDDAYVTLAGKVSLAEGKPEIRKRWKAGYNAYFPDGPDQSSAIFVAIDVTRLELWIRGVTPEPFGLRATVLERDATRRWHITSS